MGKYAAIDMTWRARLYFGPVAALILLAGVALLPLLIPGYNQIRQTVSEIGEMDSPMRVPFAAILCAVALALLVFASGLRDMLKQSGHATLPAWLAGFMAVSAAGVGIFAYPHPLHNVFGTSELIGYQAPLALALTLRSDPRMKPLARFSTIMAVLVWCAIAANLVVFDRSSALWTEMRPFYGLVQRALFATWFIWCAGVALLTWRS
jgi:hypothetical membrane protein